MNPLVMIIAMVLVLGIIPFFILLGIACKDLQETRQKMKQNEEEIRVLVFGKGEG